jgi:signal transduction histidine kinase/CheY-like chemotaxis protein
MSVVAVTILVLAASVSERRQATRRARESEGRFRQLAEELAAADRRKDEYLAMLAHELRNPLAPIRSAAQLLKVLAADEPRILRTQEIIERQVLHLAHRVDNLLEVTRLRHGKIVLQRSPLDLTSLVCTAIEDNRGLLEEAGLSLAVELPGTPLWVNGDPTRLTQVLDNLIENAAKFTDHGGRVELKLDVRSAGLSTDRVADLTVRDTGIGISPELLPHVFETFTQAEAGLDRSRGGLGLGLALVKELVQLHGGEVGVESAGPGQGAGFTLRLPLVAAPEGPRETPPAAAATLGPLRVLVVDDSRDAAQTLADLLELSGCEINVAHSGPSAIEAARQFRPEVVLCDLGLPGMDGYAVIAELRRDPATAPACMIAITGYGGEEERRRSREAGFDHHLVKPVDPNELEGLLAKAGARR